MDAAVSAPTFDGPLGLLLELVERNKLEITTISIAVITAEYLTRLNDSSRQQEMAQFVELGARLLFIKSAALLPPSSDISELSPQAELAQLNQELDEYRLMRDAARKLEQRARSTQMCHPRPLKAVRASVTLPLPTIALEQLAAVFQEALRNVPPVGLMTGPKKTYDQAHISNQIIARLRRGSLRLSSVIESCHDRLEIIVTFVALLELVKQDLVSVRQSSVFDDIHLEAVDV